MLLNSVLLRSQFCTNWSIDSVQFQSKCQQVIFVVAIIEIDKIIPKFYGNPNDLE